MRTPRNIFVCVREERENGVHGERGDGEGAGSQVILCARVSEERGHGEGMLLSCQIHYSLFTIGDKARARREDLKRVSVW